jgi:hypothetical protein
MISNKNLIGLSGWPSMRARDKLQRADSGLEKLPLGNRMKNDETRAAWN